MYVINITSDIGAAKRWMNSIKSLGNEHIKIAAMVNGILMGFSTVQEISRISENVPVISSQVGCGILVLGPGYNISEHVLALLSRISGADAVYAIRHATEYALDPSKINTLLDFLQRPLAKIKPAAPIYSGGISLGTLLRDELPASTNFMLQSGSTLCGFRYENLKFPKTIETATRILAKVIKKIYVDQITPNEIAEGLIAEHTRSNTLGILQALGYDKEA